MVLRGVAVAALAIAPAPALAGTADAPADPIAWTTPAKAPPTTLSKLFAEAAAGSPELRAARRRYEAAKAKVAGEGLLPDPMLEAGVMNVIGLMGPQLAVSQRFPLGDKLGLDRSLAEAEAEAAGFAYFETLNRVYTEIHRAYFDLYDLQREQAILGQTRALLERLRKIATTRYAVGRGQQAEALRASTEIADLMREEIALRERQARVSAQLMAILGRAATADEVLTVVETLRAPGREAEQNLEALMAGAEAKNPSLARARRELAMAEVALERAKLVATPDVTTKLGVGQAFMGTWQTAVSGTVGVDLPILSGKQREAAAVAEAESTLAARQAALEAETRQVRAAIAASVAGMRSRAEQVRLYERGLLPQARQTLDAELSSYQVGKSDFDAVLTAELSLFRLERGLARAIADYHHDHAHLSVLTGQIIAPWKESP